MRGNTCVPNQRRLSLSLSPSSPLTIRKTRLGARGETPSGSHRAGIVELGSHQGLGLSDMSEAPTSGAEFKRHPNKRSHRDEIAF